MNIQSKVGIRISSSCIFLQESHHIADLKSLPPKPLIFDSVNLAYKIHNSSKAD
jgi:hypothetical protein